MISAIFYWWLVESPKKLLFIIKKTLVYLYHSFSIGYLAKTLFAPWKRDIGRAINPSLQDIFRILVDNVISRLMGFIVRVITILSGLIIICGAAILGIIILVLWIFLPVIIIYLVYLGTTLIK